MFPSHSSMCFFRYTFFLHSGAGFIVLAFLQQYTLALTRTDGIWFLIKVADTLLCKDRVFLSVQRPTEPDDAMCPVFPVHSAPPPFFRSFPPSLP